MVLGVNIENIGIERGPNPESGSGRIIGFGFGIGARIGNVIGNHTRNKNRNQNPSKNNVLQAEATIIIEPGIGNGTESESYPIGVRNCTHHRNRYRKTIWNRNHN